LIAGDQHRIVLAEVVQADLPNLRHPLTLPARPFFLVVGRIDHKDDFSLEFPQTPPPQSSERRDHELPVRLIEIKPPAFGSSVGEFVIRDFSDRTAEPDASADGRQLRTLRYELEPMFAGTHLIRSVALEFTDQRADAKAKGEPVLLETDPLEIEVSSEWGDKMPDLDDLAVMQPPRPLSPNPFWKWAALGALLLLAVGVALYLRTRYRQHIEELLKPPSPEEVAARELKELLGRNLHGQQQYQEFYVELTGIVRRYTATVPNVIRAILYSYWLNKIMATRKNSVMVGYIESGNMNVITGMTDLISAQRSYEAALKAVETFSHIEKRTARDLGAKV